MINASFWTSCYRVSLNKVVDYVLTRHFHDYGHPRMTSDDMDCATMDGPKEQCVSLQITQLMLYKFTVDENVDEWEISVKS